MRLHVDTSIEEHRVLTPPLSSPDGSTLGCFYVPVPRSVAARARKKDERWMILTSTGTAPTEAECRTRGLRIDHAAWEIVACRLAPKPGTKASARALSNGTSPQRRPPTLPELLWVRSLFWKPAERVLIFADTETESVDLSIAHLVRPVLSVQPHPSPEVLARPHWIDARHV